MITQRQEPDGQIYHGRLIPRTRAEGPGIRGALWVAGCTIRCAGCFNQDLLERDGSTKTDIDEVFEQLTSAPDIEGVTFLGGEPFNQAAALAEVASQVRQKGLSVMTFTGYRKEHLAGGQIGGARALLDETDLLIDGPFLKGKIDTQRPWVGSTNQRILALTDRYRSQLAELLTGPDRLELTISQDGTISANGWATQEQLDSLLAQE